MKKIEIIAYYEGYGFEGTKEHQLLLFLPLSSLGSA
ncbi:hypothetical protein LYNGBM3L_53150 [Moorena producens 3L]|uniref:Uncharacterized protein n=1 Tax=Moorena producens 3L TaxID=489825 RepID=F4XYZ1_9CYAN|nr:hypothetical protein LYNGBM3L_53150 [Moorena producens 3L]